MARNIRSNRGSFVRGARRATTWVGAADVASQTNITANTSVLHQTFTTILTPFTVVRTRGLIAVSADQEAADEIQIGAMGFLVANDAAVAAGAGSLLAPIDDNGDDAWFVWQALAGEMRFLSAAGAEPQWMTTYHFDSKAMRKVEEGQSIGVLIQNAHASAAFNIWMQFRMLLKLH